MTTRLKYPVKQEETFSRKSKLFIYAIVVLLIAFLLYIQYYQKKMYNETLSEGIRIKTPVINVDCTNSNKSKSRLYFKNGKNEVKHVNVGYQQCLQYKQGDTIVVYANEQGDWYEIDPTTLKYAQQNY